MRSGLAAIIVLLVTPFIWPTPSAIAQQKQQSSKQKKTPPSKEEGASMTGCVDQQDGKYVLIRETTRAFLADLEAEGFPAEGFAKHVGHKVTVRGTSGATGTDRPLFKVRSVETVSDECGQE
jgi:hypothetical protein